MHWIPMRCVTRVIDKIRSAFLNGFFRPAWRNLQSAQASNYF